MGERGKSTHQVGGGKTLPKKHAYGMQSCGKMWFLGGGRIGINVRHKITIKKRDH